MNRGQKGLTMIEILVVMGLFVLIGGFALIVSMESFRGSSFRSDRDLYVAALQRARAQAMSNVCFQGSGCSDGMPHGVKLLSDGTFVIFQGTQYSGRTATEMSFDSMFKWNSATTTNLAEIVFSQLSGNTTPKTIIISGQGHNSTTTVSADGRICWDDVSC